LTTASTTPDGRTLEILDLGPEDGFPLLFHSGTPSGAVPAPYLEGPARERGLRVITYSRPGYGGSSARTDGAVSATVADDVADAEAVLHHLGVDEFVTLGWSGGGPRALGCAALLPQRCRAAACVAGIAPADQIDWDVREGMGEENVAEFTATMEGPGSREAFLATQTGIFSVTGEQIVGSLGSLVPPTDRAAMTPDFADALASSFRAAGRQGIVGWRDDDLMLNRPWGFDLATIAVPVSVWAGTDDAMVPFRHGQWLAEHVHGARSHLLEGEGHVSLMARPGQILDDLLDLADLALG
jgi:pimeloyl-ACP methyl ester carboxylesterase